MGAIVPLAFLLIVLILAGGVAVAVLGRKRSVRNYQRLLRAGADWRQVPADDMWKRVRALREFASSRGLQDHFHLAGRHRGLPFEAVQLRRPPGFGQRVFTFGVAVALPRPVPGPELRLARSGAFGALGQDLRVELGDAEFDRTYLLTSTDAEFARRALPAATARSLLADERTAGVVLEFAPEHLVAFRAGAATPESVLPMLDLLVDLHGAVPWEGPAGR